MKKKKNNYYCDDLFDENFNTSCYKLVMQYSYFEIIDYEYWKNKPMPFKLYRDKITQKFCNTQEFIIKGEWKKAKNEMKKIIQEHGGKYGYVWFTYCDMLKPDFEQARDKSVNAKLYFNNQYFEIREMKDIQNKIYSNLIALWEKSTK